MVQLLHQTVKLSAVFVAKLYTQTAEYWPVDILLHEQRARKIVPDPSHVSIAYREK